MFKKVFNFSVGKGMRVFLVLSFTFVFSVFGVVDDYLEYFKACYGFEIGDNKKASANFSNFFSKERPSPTYSSYLRFLFENKRLKEVQNIFNENKDALSNDPNALLYYAASLRLMRKTEAEEVYRKGLEKFPDNQDFVVNNLLLKLAQHDFKSCIDIMLKFLQEKPEAKSHYVFQYLLSQCYQAIGDVNEAKKYIRNAVELYPESSDSWLMYGLIHKQAREIDDAIYGYRRYIDLVGSNLIIEREMLAMKMHQNLEIEKDFSQVNNAIASKNYKLASALIEKLLKTLAGKNPESLKKATLLKIDLLMQKKEISQAVDFIVEQIRANSDNKEFLEIIHVIFYAVKDQKRFLIDLEKKFKDFKGTLWLNLFLADMYLRIKNTDKSIYYCKQAYGISSDQMLKSQILFQVGAIYYENKEFNKLAKILQFGTVYRSNYLPLLNLAAYFWATKGKDIELAKHLISKVIKIEPDNPHYLDTLAVINYKNDKIKDAVSILEKAHKLEPEDALIKKHLTKYRKALYEKS